MFLDDKLEVIYHDTNNRDERNVRLITFCVNSLPDPTKDGTAPFLDAIMRVDYSFQLFAKRHDDVSPTMFRDYVVKKTDKEVVDKIKKYVHWK